MEEGRNKGRKERRKAGEKLDLVFIFAYDFQNVVCPLSPTPHLYSPVVFLKL
jgi:hypothetical protein